MLELKNISKIIDDRVILNDISIIFPNTGFIGIKGKSGCGKSSLLYIMSLLDEDFLGSLFFNNEIINDVYDYRREHVSYMMQSNDYIESLTVKENIILSCEASNLYYSKKDLLAIAKRVGIDDLLERYPNTLSGGQLKRMSIAKAMLKDVDILLCDEPTGNLFEDQAKEIMQFLKDISKNKLVIIVSHDEKLLDDYCDCVLTLESGKLLGTIYEIKNKEITTKQIRKGNLLFYVVRQMLRQKYKYSVFVLFQWFLICVFLLVLSGTLGILNTINESEATDVNKNIIVVENKDHSAFRDMIRGYRYCDYSYSLELLECKTIDNKNLSSLVSFLPKDTKHIVLKSGYLPKNKYEVLVNENLYKTINDDEIHIVCDDLSMRVKVSGVIKGLPFSENTVYLSQSLKQDLSNFKDAYSLTIESSQVNEDYNKLQNDYYVYCDVIDRSENYATLLLYGKIVAFACVFMSLVISLVLYSIVSSIIHELRIHDLCYLATLGVEHKRIYKLTLIENIMISFIVVCGGIIVYELGFYYFNDVFDLYSKFYFTLIKSVIFFNEYDIYVLIFFVYIGLCCLCNHRIFHDVVHLDVLKTIREE